MEFSDDESSENETEPLAARIARQSRTTKAKVKYTLSDDDDDDDGNNFDDNDAKVSSEDEWKNIKSSESEDELSMIKVQKQPSKKTVKFTATTKAQDSEKPTGGVSSVAKDKAVDEIEIMDDDELPTVTKLPAPAEKPKKKVY